MSVSSVSITGESYSSEEKSGPDPTKNSPCQRPIHTNPRLFEFRRYLELTGVTKALGQAVGALCVENPKPNDPMRFIVDHLVNTGKVSKWHECVHSLRNELSDLKNLVMYAQTENYRLRSFHGVEQQIGEYEGENSSDFAEIEKRKQSKTSSTSSTHRRTSKRKSKHNSVSTKQ